MFVLKRFKAKAITHLVGIIVICILTSVISTNANAKNQKDESLTTTTVAKIDDPWLRPGKVLKWQGDLDGMIERGFIRILTPANRTHYFVDGAKERGIVAETANTLELVLNQKLDKHDKVRVICIPVSREDLLPMLLEGLGDVAIGNLTITPARQKIVDFSSPFITDVSELVVTSPKVPPITTLYDLSGREIWVRRSSSYFESLQALNNRFATEKHKKINIKLASENLEDNSLLEMVNAGLYPATVVDSHKLEWVWGKVFSSDSCQ